MKNGITLKLGLFFLLIPIMAWSQSLHSNQQMNGQCAINFDEQTQTPLNELRFRRLLPVNGLFSSKELITLRISLPISKIKEKAVKNTEQRDGVEVDRSKSWVMGSINGFEAKIRARGLTSLNELDFPKLRIEIETPVDVKDDFFKSSKNILLNTEGTIIEVIYRRTRARKLGPDAPQREKLAYDLAESFSVLTPLTRLIRLELVDETDSRVYHQFALLVESKSGREKRLKAQNISNTDYTELKLPVKSEDAVPAHLFNQLIGNGDYNLRAMGEKIMSVPFNLFNTEVYRFGSHEYIPMVYDFDLAVAVRGFLTEDLIPTSISLDMKNAALKLKKRYSLELIKKSYKKILSEKNVLYQKVFESGISPLGKELFYAHLDSFFTTWDEIFKADDTNK